MRILYTRVSSIDQRTDRQRVEESKYDLIIEDTCSGSLHLWDRNGGRKIRELIDQGIVSEINVWTIDRLGRDLRDILNSIHYFNEKKIPVRFLSQGLTTIDSNGKENSVTKMIISILGVVGEMERSQIRERQAEGIKLAKLRGVYQGRTKGSKEDSLKFLSKPKNQKALSLLKKGYKGVEVSKIVGIHVNTITKIKKLGLT